MCEGLSTIGTKRAATSVVTDAASHDADACSWSSASAAWSLPCAWAWSVGSPSRCSAASCTPCLASSRQLAVPLPPASRACISTRSPTTLPSVGMCSSAHAWTAAAVLRGLLSAQAPAAPGGGGWRRRRRRGRERDCPGDGSESELFSILQNRSPPRPERRLRRTLRASRAVSSECVPPHPSSCSAIHFAMDAGSRWPRYEDR